MAKASDSSIGRESALENAKRIYESEVLPKYLKSHRFRYIAIDGVSGDYEVQDNDPWSLDRLLKRHPDAVVYSRRIGCDFDEAFESVDELGPATFDESN